ncbi:hypothetical protein PV797_00620 [Clostridiaceae bacterium M8S5]|nr:hypothetical protein PV797_00620 [Clostridiaceae bacterium M8S5]
MDNHNTKQKQISTNGYDIILDTYNKYKYPIIENQINALTFPWKLQNGSDIIDTMKFCQKELDEEFNNLK